MAEKSKYKLDKQKDPKEPRPGGKRKKKVYPPHWEIRQFGADKTGGAMFTVHSKSIKWQELLDVMFKRLGDSSLFRMLSWDSIETQLCYFAEVWPHTKDWPVRFLQGQPVECGREVIK